MRNEAAKARRGCEENVNRLSWLQQTRTNVQTSTGKLAPFIFLALLFLSLPCFQTTPQYSLSDPKLHRQGSQDLLGFRELRRVRTVWKWMTKLGLCLQIR